MITCQELEQLYAKGIFACTAAERSAARNHINHCAKCRGEVLDRLEWMRQNYPPEKRQAIREIARAVRDNDLQDPEIGRE